MILQIIDHREHLRGQCIIGTQSLWGSLDKKMAMETAGYYMLLPLFLEGLKLIHFRSIWHDCKVWHDWWTPLGKVKHGETIVIPAPAGVLQARCRWQNWWPFHQVPWLDLGMVRRSCAHEQLVCGRDASVWSLGMIHLGKSTDTPLKKMLRADLL